MNIKMLKMAFAGLVLSVSGFANAGLITTTFAGGNEGDGNMFDVEIFDSSIMINSFYINTFPSVGTQFIYLYTRSGTYDGFQNNGLGWNLMGSAIVNNASGNTPVLFDIGDFLLQSNSITGFFITGDISNGSLAYSDGSMTVNDSYMEIRSGLRGGISFAGGNHFAGTVYTPRTWNGTINYTNVPEPSTLAIFALGLMGLASRRFKKQS
ncbi:MAG: hypothetical protein ACJASL_004556 [Paraglaciecola sp.]|jgi:hypothetical protein